MDTMYRRRTAGRGSRTGARKKAGGMSRRERRRLFQLGASLALFLLVFGSVALLGLAMDNGFVLPALPAWLAAALPGLLAIVSVGGFALSYCISQAVYAKKEF